ncbi:hypothetical protein [Ammoniphilus sp. CFH 90114]|uniref:hypothetical protein n=1 Tax=Ammoniphilus sp. CFH 90114 TaxID=2493665 RepID=UPI0013E988ED|nr:hypothetical protein [Ammoniphilus sp. CFH 90114]
MNFDTANNSKYDLLVSMLAEMVVTYMNSKSTKERDEKLEKGNKLLEDIKGEDE